MSQQKLCPRCQAPAPLDAATCLRAGCGHQFRTGFSEPDRTQLAISPQQQVWQQPAPSAYEPTIAARRPPDPHVHPTETRSDTCAIMSVVFGGIAALLFCFAGWIFGIAGFILGIVSLFRIARDPYLTGRPMAVTGIALSSLPLGFALYLVVVWLIAVTVPPPPAQPTPLYVPTPAANAPSYSATPTFGPTGQASPPLASPAPSNLYPPGTTAAANNGGGFAPATSDIILPCGHPLLSRTAVGGGAYEVACTEDDRWLQDQDGNWSRDNLVPNATRGRRASQKAGRQAKPAGAAHPDTGLPPPTIIQREPAATDAGGIPGARGGGAATAPISFPPATEAQLQQALALNDYPPGTRWQAGGNGGGGNGGDSHARVLLPCGDEPQGRSGGSNGAGPLTLTCSRDHRFVRSAKGVWSQSPAP